MHSVLFQALDELESERDELREKVSSLSSRVVALEEETVTLQRQLDETRDQSELLEFQLLEMTANRENDDDAWKVVGDYKRLMCNSPFADSNSGNANAQPTLGDFNGQHW